MNKIEMPERKKGKNWNPPEEKDKNDAIYFYGLSKGFMEYISNYIKETYC